MEMTEETEVIEVVPEVVPTDEVEVIEELGDGDEGSAAVGGVVLGVGAALLGVVGWKYAKKAKVKIRDRYEQGVLDRAAKIERAIKARPEDEVVLKAVEESTSEKRK